MNIYFRLDCDEKIGSGHLMRCMALAEAFKEKGIKPIILTKSDNAEVKQTLLNRKIDCQFIPKNIEFKDEANFIETLPDQECNLGIIVDRYHLPRDYFRGLKEKYPDWTLAQVDDWGKPYEAVDLILNQNIYASENIYSINSEDNKPILLTGLKYSLIRNEFKKIKIKSEVSDEVKNLLITLGGGDHALSLLKIMKTLKDIPGNPNIHVIVGFKSWNHELEAYVKDHPQIKIWKDVKNMAKIMSKIDLSINGAGSTLWELYFMGIPNVAYVMADNQEKIAFAAAQSGCSIVMGKIEEFNGSKLKEIVVSLMKSKERRQNMHLKEKESVDGLGPSRVCDSFLECSKN